MVDGGLIADSRTHSHSHARLEYTYDSKAKEEKRQTEKSLVKRQIVWSHFDEIITSFCVVHCLRHFQIFNFRQKVFAQTGSRQFIWFAVWISDNENKNWKQKINADVSQSKKHNDTKYVQSAIAACCLAEFRIFSVEICTLRTFSILLRTHCCTAFD